MSDIHALHTLMYALPPAFFVWVDTRESGLNILQSVVRVSYNMLLYVVQ